MKVWITKYALTQGIEEVDSEEVFSFEIEGKYLSFNRKKSSLPEIYSGEGKAWHRSKESAIKRAEEMRDKKIENLQKQVAKLQILRFD